MSQVWLILTSVGLCCLHRCSGYFYVTGDARASPCHSLCFETAGSKHFPPPLLGILQIRFTKDRSRDTQFINVCSALHPGARGVMRNSKGWWELGFYSILATNGMFIALQGANCGKVNHGEWMEEGVCEGPSWLWPSLTFTITKFPPRGNS